MVSEFKDKGIGGGSMGTVNYGILETLVQTPAWGSSRFVSFGK